MGGMVVDTKLVRDELGDAAAGPDRATKPKSFRPLGQQSDEVLALRGVKQGGGTRCRVVA
jgi:hypothetical protein